MKAVIFDMDGTLFNSEPLHVQSEILTLKDYGIQNTDDVYSLIDQTIGRPNEHAAHVFSKHFGVYIDPADYVRDKQNHLLRLYRNKVDFAPIEGAQTLIKALYEAGYPLAVASSSDQIEIDTLMDRFDFKKYFKVLLSGQFLERKKPHPDIFLNAAWELGVQASSCLIFEDSPTGIQAAKSAGAVVIAIQNQHAPMQLDLSLADYVIKDFTEICVKEVQNCFEKHRNN